MYPGEGEGECLYPYPVSISSTTTVHAESFSFLLVRQELPAYLCVVLRMDKPDRAEEIAAMLVGTNGALWDKTVSAGVSLIANALRAYQDEVLEDCAKVAEQVGLIEAKPSDDYEKGWDRAARNIAEDIRELKTPEAGGKR